MILATIISGSGSFPIEFVESMLKVKDYEWIIQKGSSIYDNRNAVFERARILNDDLLFIDSDMVFTREDVEKIEEHLKTYDIMSGMCVMSYEGHPISIFGQDLKLMSPQEGVFEIGGCGSAFLGISKKVIQTLTEPFSPIKYEKTGQFYGEDISFCINARVDGFKLYCDRSLKIGHIKNKILYPNEK